MHVVVRVDSSLIKEDHINHAIAVNICEVNKWNIICWGFVINILISQIALLLDHAVLLLVLEKLLSVDLIVMLISV